MKKKNNRWYEKDEHLKAFMALLNNLDKDIQNEIALEIIMKTSELTDRKFDKMLRDVAEFEPKDYKRWYDTNPNIHLAIESIKDLGEQDRQTVILEVCENILKEYPQQESEE